MRDEQAREERRRVEKALMTSPGNRRTIYLTSLFDAAFLASRSPDAKAVDQRGAKRTHPSERQELEEGSESNIVAATDVGPQSCGLSGHDSRRALVLVYCARTRVDVSRSSRGCVTKFIKVIGLAPRHVPCGASAGLGGPKCESSPER